MERHSPVSLGTLPPFSLCPRRHLDFNLELRLGTHQARLSTLLLLLTRTCVSSALPWPKDARMNRGEPLSDNRTSIRARLPQGRWGEVKDKRTKLERPSPVDAQMAAGEQLETRLEGQRCVSALNRSYTSVSPLTMVVL